MHGVGDSDLRGLAGGFLDSGDFEDAVEIETHAAEDIHGDVRRGESSDGEVTDQDVLQGICVFALIDLDVNHGLLRAAGHELFGTSQRQRSVAADDGLVAVMIGKAAALAVKGNSEREWGNVHQDAIDIFAGKAGGHDACAEGDAEIGMNVLAGLDVHEASEALEDERGAGGSANKKYSVDIAGLFGRILQGLRDAVDGGIDEGADEFFVFDAG